MRYRVEASENGKKWTELLTDDRTLAAAKAQQIEADGQDAWITDRDAGCLLTLK